MLKKLVLFCAIAVLCGGANAAPDTAALADKMSTVHRQITERLNNLRAANNLDAAASLLIIQQEASPIFNYEKLARRALGKNWKKADDAQRAAVADLFRRVLEKTYAKVFALYSGQTFGIAETKVTSNDKVQMTVEIKGGGKSAVLEYILGPDADGDYRIENVKVEGVSLAANYRRQFSQLVRKNGVDGLIEKLKQLSAN